jgi:hypothetical protein
VFQGGCKIDEGCYYFNSCPGKAETILEKFSDLAENYFTTLQLYSEANMAKKEKVVQGVSLLDKVTGYRSRRGRRRGDPNAALFQWREAFRELLKGALEHEINAIAIRAVVGALSREPFFDSVPEKKRYRRSYNYFEQSQDHIPPGWKVEKIGSYLHLVVEPPDLEEDPVELEE